MSRHPILAVHVVDLTGSDVVVEVTDASPTHLSPRDRRILAWSVNGSVMRAERSGDHRQFGISPTRYFQILNGLLLTIHARCVKTHGGRFAYGVCGPPAGDASRYRAYSGNGH